MMISPIQKLGLLLLLDAASNDRRWLFDHPTQVEELCALAGISPARIRGMNATEAKKFFSRLQRSTSASSTEEPADE